MASTERRNKPPQRTSHFPALPCIVKDGVKSSRLARRIMDRPYA